MAKPRYITFYGYFGPTSNVKEAPIAIGSEAIGRLLKAVPDRPQDGGAK